MMYMMMMAGNSRMSIFLFNRFSRCSRSSGVKFLMNSGACCLCALESSTLVVVAFSSVLPVSSPLNVFSAGESAISTVPVSNFGNFKLVVCGLEFNDSRSWC